MNSSSSRYRLSWLSACVVLLLGVTGVVPTTRASETDQYYAWGKPLEDSLEPLNERINAGIAAELEAINRRDNGAHHGCDQVSRAILGRFRLIGVHRIELWAQLSPRIRTIPSNDAERAEYPARHIYRYDPPFYYRLTFTTLGYTINVDGIRFGTDKLGHFFMQGWRYLRVYQKALGRGLPEEAAVEEAVRFGIRQEKGVLGVRSSGIFSYGDLESNFQGFRFYRALCQAESPALVRTEEGWTMPVPFDLREYVNPHWDESFNNPAYTSARWAAVRRALLETCPRFQHPDVVEMWRRYQARVRPEEGREILARLIREGVAPDPAGQSIRDVCGEP